MNFSIHKETWLSSGCCGRDSDRSGARASAKRLKIPAAQQAEEAARLAAQACKPGPVHAARALAGRAMDGNAEAGRLRRA